MLTKSDADTQFVRRVFLEMTRALARELGQPLDVKVLAGMARYHPPLRAGDFDLVFSDDSNVYLDAVEKWRVQALVTPLMFEGSTPVCLYVKNASGIRRPEDLRDKRVGMLQTELYYAILASLLGQSPVRMVGKLQTVEVAQSALLALGLDQLDAALVNRVVVRYLRLTNPGAVKDLRELACGPIVPIPPYFVKPGLSAHTKKRIIQVLLSANANPKFPEFRRMAQATNGRLVAADPKQYEPLLKLQREGRKKGYFDDYQAFLRTRH